jgi:6-phosphofructokinase 1
MNACVRAAVRRAVADGHEVVGILRGFQGILEEKLLLDADGRNIRINGLIPIGGDGTFRGCIALAKYWSGKIVGCPGTIDNDLLGTDYTIGFSTAVQTAVDAVDKVRDTAESHERMFLVEVMGRHCGYIAVHTAIAGGAEIICIPETPTDVEGIVKQLHELKGRQKKSVIMIVAEGDEEGNAAHLQAELAKRGSPFPSRVVVLGHMQRGGSPTQEDRILASQLGAFAVQSILQGHTGVMAGRVGVNSILTPFEETIAQHKPIPTELLELIAAMSQ